MKIASNELSEALVLYTGWGMSPFPRMDASVVIDRFGDSRGHQLLWLVNEIFRDTGAIPVDWSKETLATVGHVARDYVHHKYPGLSEEALKALVWKYTFDWR